MGGDGLDFRHFRPHVEDSLHPYGRGTRLGDLHFSHRAAFADKAGVTVETRDISLSGRILAAMSDLLPAEQKAQDALAELEALAQTRTPTLSNFPTSASIPQLKAAIAELQALGFDLPNYPDDPVEKNRT